MLTQILRTYLKTPRVLIMNSFRFSTTTEADQTRVKLTAEDKMANFYRNSIRKINVNDKGRGKFTEHHLIQLIKLTQKADQVELLFQAYYNYLGHFTIISNSTVDRMIQKILSFEEPPLQKVIEIFHNHNYLGYFPHYTTTFSLLKATAKDHNLLLKLVRVFKINPLIKFDKDIVEFLVAQTQQEDLPILCFSQISKVLVERSNFSLLDQIISPAQILNVIASGLEKAIQLGKYQTLKPNQAILTFLNNIKGNSQRTEADSYKLAITSLAFNDDATFSEQLGLIKSQQATRKCLQHILHSQQALKAKLIEHLSHHGSESTRSLLNELTQEVSQ